MSPEWLAGFFDGEGTFWLGTQIKKSNGREYPRAIVLVSQSGDDGLALLERIQKEYGGSVYQHLKPGQHKATKPAYKLYWNRTEAIVLISRIYPFLELKQKAAKAVLDYLNRNDE